MAGQQRRLLLCWWLLIFYFTSKSNIQLSLQHIFSCYNSYARYFSACLNTQSHMQPSSLTSFVFLSSLLVGCCSTRPGLNKKLFSSIFLSASFAGILITKLLLL
ncbi:hypothetical protein V8G54_030309 [Vigna mungo]|uniref:Secreted protein n=1 Tax=Vigna mungo TaxID=3915 RepID=A0AAQ3RMP9_VIGMU